MPKPKAENLAKRRPPFPNDDLGLFGENTAVSFLLEQGVVVRHRNWRCSAGEIDIIAEKDEYLLFVEVKARKDLSAGHPLEAVNHRKQRQILNAAKLYLQKYPPKNLYPRFDIIAILFDSDPPTIEWVPGAFGDA